LLLSPDGLGFGYQEDCFVSTIVSNSGLGWGGQTNEAENRQSRCSFGKAGSHAPVSTGPTDGHHTPGVAGCWTTDRIFLVMPAGRFFCLLQSPGTLYRVDSWLSKRLVRESCPVGSIAVVTGRLRACGRLSRSGAGSDRRMSHVGCLQYR